MPIEHIDIEIKLIKKRRDRVHLVLDPRGFFKTTPVFTWIWGMDPAIGEDYASMVKWCEGKILETYMIPKQSWEKK